MLTLHDVLTPASSFGSKGWQDERMDQHFVEQRQNAANVNDELEIFWYKKMEIVFKEIDSVSQCISPDGAFSFLDLGLDIKLSSSFATLMPYFFLVAAQVDLHLTCSHAMPWLWVMASRSASHRADMRTRWIIT